MHLGYRPDQFIWASGIEDTFIPQTRRGYRALDEYELIGHYEHWREDLAVAREVGVQALRWGVPWYRVEPRRGEFDWSWTDQVLPYLVEELGITPIVDLMHYGCPFWLEREFINADYPQAVASYAAAFARRYTGLVRWYTPLNEPLMTARMCGQNGVWPPYLRGWPGYVRIMLQLVKGIIRSVQAIKEIDPSAMMVHVEAAGLTRASQQDLEMLAEDDQRRRELSYDLLTGSVTPDHPRFLWLIWNNASMEDLTFIAQHPIALDVMGLNFYPQWSTRQLYIHRRGHVTFRSTEHEGSGFAAMIDRYYRRYGVPIMVTETSAAGPPEIRSAWLEASVAAVRQLRSRGVPVLGYTWFPLFTMYDWRYRFGRAPLEQYRVDLGLYTLSSGGDARWQGTPLVEQLRGYIANPEDAVGPLEETPSMRETG